MPDTTETLRDLVRAYVTEQCTVLIDAEPGLREHEPIIHPTRVAARRLRSTLRTYAELVDADRADALTVELRWIAGLLGEVRDRDVLEKRLLDDVAELSPELVVGPVATQISEELGAHRKAAWDALIETLDGERYRALLAELHRWRGDLPLTAAADKPAAKVTKYIKRAEKKLDKRLHQAIEAQLAGDPEADHLLHQARKAGKRARYCVELAAPVLGGKADKIIDRRKDLQDVLGEHQDSSVAAEFLRGEGIRVGIRSGHNGFTYGILYAREAARRAAVVDRLRPFSS